MIFLSGWSRKWLAPKVTCDERGGNENGGAESVAPKSRGCT